MELLQKYHQGIRSEIEARGAKFTDCADLGKALLTRKHRDSAEVRPRLFVPPPSPGSLLSSDLITFVGVIILFGYNGTNRIPSMEGKSPPLMRGLMKQTLIRNAKV